MRDLNSFKAKQRLKAIRDKKNYASVIYTYNENKISYKSLSAKQLCNLKVYCESTNITTTKASMLHSRSQK